MSFSVGSAPWGMPPGPAQPQLHPSMALPPTGVPSGMPPAAFNYPPPNPMLAPPPGKALYHLQLSSCQHLVLLKSERNAPSIPSTWRCMMVMVALLEGSVEGLCR